MMSLGIVLLLLLSPLSFAVNSISIRFYQTKIPPVRGGILAFQGAFCLFAALLYATGIRSLPSVWTVLSGISFGVCFFVTLVCSARCYEIGPMSLTAVLVNASLVLPLIWSVLFFQEQVTVKMVAGIRCVGATFVLSSFGARENRKRSNAKWFLLVTIAFVCNGATAILQKTRQQAEPEGDLFVFPCIAYFTAAVLLFLAFYLKKDRGPFLPLQRRPLFVLFILTAGAGTFLGNCLLQMLCTEIPAGILYPTVNGGLCVITAMASFVIFREKPTVLKMLSILSGVAGIVILNL